MAEARALPGGTVVGGRAIFGAVGIHEVLQAVTHSVTVGMPVDTVEGSQVVAGTVSTVVGIQVEGVIQVTLIGDEAAVAEGATIVRIGTAIFGERNYA